MDALATIGRLFGIAGSELALARLWDWGVINTDSVAVVQPLARLQDWSKDREKSEHTCMQGSGLG